MRKEFKDLLVTWPDDDATIQLNVIEEEDEPPVEMTEAAITLAGYYWGQTRELDEGESTSDFAEVIYPEKMRVYYKKKRVSLNTFHGYLEVGLSESLKLALETIKDKLEDTTP